MKTSRIIQITDPHLFANADGKLKGVPTRKSLNAVLERIKAQYNDFECLLVTGDLTQDGSEASYQYLKEALTVFERPCFWLCGNHDEPEIMTQLFPEAMEKRVEMNNWQILLLNSQVYGSIHGHLAETELAFLEKNLAQYPQLNTLIALHHHPETIQSRWMDEIALDNPSELKRIINKYQQVKVIIHGHTHQHREYSLTKIPLLATPSTCIQFTPHSEAFQVDTLQPGFRVLDLRADGQFQSQVIRLTDFPLTIDEASNGY